MTPDEEKMIQLRQAQMLDLQRDLLRQTKILTLMYVLIFLIGTAIALIMFLNKGTNEINGEKIDKLIEAISKR